jgi:hypothetical protein
VKKLSQNRPGYIATPENFRPHDYLAESSAPVAVEGREERGERR